MDENQSVNDHLIPGRECGGCTVCCKAPKINVPELKKLAAVLCEHCTEDVGCRIYETRPSVCKGWYCGWRRMQYLNNDWRPDRCGVLIDIVGGEGEGIPADFPQVGLKFDIVDSPRVLTCRRFCGCGDSRMPRCELLEALSTTRSLRVTLCRFASY